MIDESSFPEDEDLRVMTFATTPIMSTYLLAFVVGEFDFVEGETDDGIQVRVYTPLGRAEQGRFALEVGQLSTNRFACANVWLKEYYNSISAHELFFFK